MNVSFSWVFSICICDHMQKPHIFSETNIMSPLYHWGNGGRAPCRTVHLWHRLSCRVSRAPTALPSAMHRNSRWISKQHMACTEGEALGGSGHIQARGQPKMRSIAPLSPLSCREWCQDWADSGAHQRGLPGDTLCSYSSPFSVSQWTGNQTSRGIWQPEGRYPYL